MITIGTKLRLYPDNTWYEITKWHIGIGEDGNWQAFIEMKDLQKNTHHEFAHWMIFEMIKGGQLIREGTKNIEELKNNVEVNYVFRPMVSPIQGVK